MVHPLENILVVPQKLNIELLYDPAILFLGVYPKELKQVFKQILVHQYS